MLPKAAPYASLTLTVPHRDAVERSPWPAPRRGCRSRRSVRSPRRWPGTRPRPRRLGTGTGRPAGPTLVTEASGIMRRDLLRGSLARTPNGPRSGPGPTTGQHPRALAPRRPRMWAITVVELTPAKVSGPHVDRPVEGVAPSARASVWRGGERSHETGRRSGRRRRAAPSTRRAGRYSRRSNPAQHPRQHAPRRRPRRTSIGFLPPSSPVRSRSAGRAHRAGDEAPRGGRAGEAARSRPRGRSARARPRAPDRTTTCHRSSGKPGAAPAERDKASRAESMDWASGLEETRAFPAIRAGRPSQTAIVKG